MVRPLVCGALLAISAAGSACDDASLLSTKIHSKLAREALRINMVWTRDTASLTSRIPMMTLDTACKHHPGAEFHFYLQENSGAAVDESVVQAMQEAGCSLHREYFNPFSFFEGTPFEAFAQANMSKLMRGPFHVTMVTNLVRAVAMWKHGGWYLDTDLVLLQPLPDLPNCAAYQEGHEVNNAVLRFEPGSVIVDQLALEAPKRFNVGVFASMGPVLLTDAVNSLLPEEREHLTVLGKESFYPVPWKEAKSIFNQTVTEEKSQEILKNSYALHAWNFMSKSIRALEGSLFDRAYKKNCVICSLTSSSR